MHQAAGSRRIIGMATNRHILLGDMRLEQRDDGSIIVVHAKLRYPMEVRASSLAAWLRRGLRDEVFSAAKPDAPKVAA